MSNSGNVFSKIPVPEWLSPSVRTCKGQHIHKYLWDKDWLTNPSEAQPGMWVYNKNGDGGRIKEVWLADGQVNIKYRHEHGYKTVSARELRNDPNRVVV